MCPVLAHKYHQFIRSLTGREIFISAALCAVIGIYIFYFLMLPQSWGLMDDYRSYSLWGKPGLHAWDEFVKVTEGLMDVGRFRPMDFIIRLFRYKFLPVTPRVFHLTQFFLAIVALISLVFTLKKSGLKRVQILLALLVVSANLSMKEWLVYTTSAETLATTFFMMSVALYVYEHRIFSALCFLLALASKESAFVFLAPFALFVWIQKKPSLKRKQDIWYLATLMVVTLGFILFIRNLPHVYTSGLSLRRTSFAGLATAFVMPFLKSFGPVVPFLTYNLYKNRGRTWHSYEKTLLLFGASLAISYTVLIAAWGPFDSWFYLHIPIPFGWAIVIGAMWQPLKKEKDIPLEDLFLWGIVAHLFFATLNGSRNLYNYFEDAKTVAQIACEDATRVSGLKIFNNCNEGSSQLKEALVVTKSCARPPEFIYLQDAKTLPLEHAEPYLMIYSKKCDTFPADTLKADSRLQLGAWTLVKRYKL